MKMGLALAAFALALPGAVQAAPRIGEIRAQLYYEATGRLSSNIAPPAAFTGWNTIIGEGDAEEPANDILVTVEVIGGRGEENLSVPLQIVIRGPRGRVLARQSFGGMLVTGRGRLWKGLWLHDVGCAGRIEIVASIGANTRHTALSLDCGE
jgi:hypothetical protein